MVLEKTLESPLDSNEIQSVHPKGNQSRIFIGRTDAEAETPILWPPDVKNWLTGKDPDAGKHWGQEEKGPTGNEMAGWHHQLYGHDFEQASGVGDGQGSLVCCSSWGHKELDTTEWLNWTELDILLVQSLSCVWLFVTPWTKAHQDSLSFSISLSLLKLMSIESVMPYACLHAHYIILLSVLVFT